MMMAVTGAVSASGLPGEMSLVLLTRGPHGAEACINGEAIGSVCVLGLVSLL